MADLLPYRFERTDALIPYARNARTHSDAQIGKIAASIREFGFTSPVLVDGDRGIIAGHGRVLAAQRLGMDEVPVLEIGHLTPAQRKAYILADNRLALDAGWDTELLRIEFGELQINDFNLGLTGFSPEEMRDIVFPIPRKQKSAERGLGDGLSFQVIVQCEDENQQAEVLEDLRSRGISCKPLIL